MDASALPIGQLESLKFKTVQIIESIQALQRLLLDAGVGGGAAMPSWPDILAKYNLLLSQTHTLSTALIAPPPSHTHSQSLAARAAADKTPAISPFARLALHPVQGLPDTQLDNGLAPLLRNQQTTEVLRVENAAVRRLSARLPNAPPTDHAAVLRECAAIRAAHDQRCDRAVRAVAMLREKYEWRARVAVETAEPEDYVPLINPDLSLNLPRALSPRSPLRPPNGEADGGNGNGDVLMDTPGQTSGESEDEEEELEEVLGPSIHPTPGAEEGASPTPRDMN